MLARSGFSLPTRTTLTGDWQIYCVSILSRSTYPISKTAIDSAGPCTRPNSHTFGCPQFNRWNNE